MILTNSGVLKLMQRIKSFITAQLNTKAPSVHTHTLSEIDDLSSLQMGGGYTKSEVDTLLNGKADTSHTHTKSQITDFPTIPSKVSQLTNDSGFITGVSWDSVSNKPSTFTPSSHTHTKSQITDFPSLATVATSGSYSDLSNRSLLTVNGATSLGWSGIGGVANGSTLQLCTTDNTSPSICFHRAGYSHVVLAEAGGVLGIQAQGSDWLELATKSWVTSLGYITSSGSCNYANSAGSAGSVAWTNVSGRPTALSQFTNDSGYITADGAAYPRRVGGVTMNFNWSGQGGQPTWLWGGEDGTNMYVYNPANFSVNYATNSGYTNWLRTSSHTDHLFHTEWDGSYFWTYVTASDGGYRAVRVERSNSSGWADSAGSVAWGNVSGRPTALSQFTNDSGFLTSHQDLSGYIPKSGGAVLSGTTFGRINDTDSVCITGGTNDSNGGQITLIGASHPWVDAQGAIRLQPNSKTNYKQMYMYPSGTWTWGGTAVQITSDARLKQQISKIDNALLDAWQDVDLVQFKYNDAIEEKGDNARLHTGYVVQQINEACQKHDVDISEYGLYCHEEYPERTEEVEVEKEDGTTIKETKVIEEASEHYSLRYTEVYAVECAYLRRENKRLNDRLTTLEELFKQYIAK